jgi:hypothetical protein
MGHKSTPFNKILCIQYNSVLSPHPSVLHIILKGGVVAICPEFPDKQGPELFSIVSLIS